MDERKIEQLVWDVLKAMEKESTKLTESKEESNRLGMDDYPLQEKRPELIRSKTGKKLDELTLEAVMKGEIKFEDFSIHPDTLEYQAQIAEAAGRPQLAANLRRAKELTAVPDEEILEMYNALRPNRSSKEELLKYADRLEKVYNAPTCAKFIREAAEVYEKQNMLR